MGEKNHFYQKFQVYHPILIELTKTISVVAIKCLLKLNWFCYKYLYIISYYTINFSRKLYAKNQKTKNAFLDPQKTFSYKTYEKNFVLLKKFALKVPSEYRKNGQGKKFRGPKIMKFIPFGGL